MEPGTQFTCFTGTKVQILTPNLTLTTQCYDTHHDSSAAERLSNDIASKALDNPEIDPSRVLVIVTSQYAWEGTKQCISSFRPPLLVAFFLASYFFLVTSQYAWRARIRALVALGLILVVLVALGLIH